MSPEATRSKLFSISHDRRPNEPSRHRLWATISRSLAGAELMNKYTMPALLLSFGLLGCGPTMAQFNTLKGNVNQNSDSIRSLEKATDRLKNHLDYNDATSEFNEYIQMRASSSEKHLSMFIAQMTKKMTTLSGIYMGLIESNPSDPIKLDCYYKLAQVYDRMAD